MCKNKNRLLSVPFLWLIQFFVPGILLYIANICIFYSFYLNYPSKTIYFYKLRVSRIVKGKFIVTCQRIEEKIFVKVWDLQLALSHPSANAMNPLFQKEFDETDPHPLRIWTMHTDEFQIVLSSEVRDGNNEPYSKSIITLNFV